MQVGSSVSCMTFSPIGGMHVLIAEDIIISSSGEVSVFNI